MFLLETTNLKAVNTGLQDTLRSGSFVVFTVKKKLDSNLYQISLSGKQMSVSSSKTLTEGSRLRAQVTWLGNRLQLNVSPKNEPIIDLLMRSNIIIKNETQMIAEGLIRSGMPLLPEYFEKIQQSLRKHKKPDDRLVKILLLLIDKGIPLNDKNLSEIELKGNMITIGRGSDNHIVMDNETVSRRHCILEKKFIHWFLTDVGSTNGTFINRNDCIVKLVKGEFELAKGDKIRLGNSGGPFLMID